MLLLFVLQIMSGAVKLEKTKQYIFREIGNGQSDVGEIDEGFHLQGMLYSPICLLMITSHGLEVST